MCVHSDQIISLFQLLLVPLCLDLRNAETDQTTGDTAGRCSNSGATKRSHYWTCGDKGTQARNCQRANPCQQSKDAACGSASNCSRRGAFWRLARFHVTDVTR